MTKSSEAKLAFGCPGLTSDENQSATTHVESTLVPRLDEGSNPSSSTMYFRTKSENSRQTSDYQIVPRFFVSNPIGLRTDKRPKKDLLGRLSVTKSFQVFLWRKMWQKCDRFLCNQMVFNKFLRPNSDLTRKIGDILTTRFWGVKVLVRHNVWFASLILWFLCVLSLVRY